MKIERIFDNNSNITLENLINSIVDMELDNFFNLNTTTSYPIFKYIKSCSKKEEIQ